MNSHSNRVNRGDGGLRCRFSDDLQEVIVSRPRQRSTEGVTINWLRARYQRAGVGGSLSRAAVSQLLANGGSVGKPAKPILRLGTMAWFQKEKAVAIMEARKVGRPRNPPPAPLSPQEEAMERTFAPTLGE